MSFSVSEAEERVRAIEAKKRAEMKMLRNFIVMIAGIVLIVLEEE